MPTTSTPRTRTGTAVRTTVGMKILMAVTGVLFLGFVIVHMYGNLKVFAGQEAFDDYAHHLRTLGEPFLPYSGFLWVMRVVLLAAVAGHVWAAVVLWRRAGRARTIKYVTFAPVQATWSSLTMRWGGLAILLFIVFHLLQFTTVTIEIGGSFTSPYDRVVAAFETWYVTAIYAAAMIALGMHLRHGIWSVVQTLGWSTHRRQPAIKLTALAIALIVVIGFLLPPVTILIGLVP